MRYFLVLLFIFSSAFANTPYFLIESEKALSIKEVQSLEFKKKDNDISNWGYSNKVFWFKLEADDLPQKSAVNTIEIKYPLEYIEYYYFNNDKYEKILAGEKFPKEALYKNVILPLSEDRAKPIYFRVKTRTAVQFNYEFWSENDLLSHINVSQFGFGLFFGIILFAVLFSMITYFWLKDRTYFYMSIFLVFYGGLQMAMNRFGQQFLWPGNDFLNLKSVPILSGLTYGSFLIFMSSLLDIKRKQRGFAVSISALLLISACVSVAPFFIGYRPSMFMSIVYMTFVSSFIFCVGILKYKQSTLALDKKVAKFFVISWTPFLLGIMTLVLKVMGMIPTNIFTNYMLQMGSIISIFMFVVLTGEKFKTLREQKERSDKSALNASFAKETIIKNNSQIAHDVRSPLSALEFYMESIKKHIPEKDRKIGLTAFRRLEDIINNLSTKKSKGLEGESYLVSEILQDIVSEKRYENIKSSTTLMLDNNSSNHALFLKVNLSSLSRSLSNILNNAYEAEASSVQVEYAQVGKSIEIKVIDNGKGIEKSYQDKIFEDGYTRGKENGSGLGLSYVKKFVEENNGKILFSSNNYGTTITISLPCATAPAWFVNELNIFNKNIIIVDDEVSIYNLWVSKLCEFGINESNLLYFEDPNKFKAWALTEHKEDNLYLVDYEFLDEDINGLDLISELGIYSNSILVTSRYANQGILNKIKKDNLRMIPKFCIQRTKVSTNEPVIQSSSDFVLIDDDSLVRSIWMANAEKKNQNLICFESIEKFMISSEALELDKSTHIYIDSQLGDVRGETESEKIYRAGFENLHITTGLSAEDIKKPFWIKSVVGKQPQGLSRGAFT
jgi:signal transduction histidine kinase